MPKAGVLFPLKAPSGHKRSCFIDIDEERLDQDGRILVYDLVYFAVALASQTKQTFSAALTAIRKRVPSGQRASVLGPRATPRGAETAAAFQRDGYGCWFEIGSQQEFHSRASLASARDIVRRRTGPFGRKDLGPWALSERGGEMVPALRLEQLHKLKWQRQ